MSYDIKDGSPIWAERNPMTYAIVVKIDDYDHEVTLNIYRGNKEVGELTMPKTGEKRIGDRYTVELKADGHDREF